jgi:hypothetical protein
VVPANQRGHPAGIHITKPETDEATVVITTATMFEKMLELAIIVHSGTVPSETDRELLFEYPGALSSFAAKINLCAMLGFLTADMRHDLDVIRDVQNRFCHSLLKRQFTDQDIAQKCATLVYASGKTSDPAKPVDIQKSFARHGPPGRIQFVFASLILIYMLMLMFVRRFREAKVLDPLRTQILEESKAIVREKFSELVAQKAKVESEQESQHLHQELTALASIEGGPSPPPGASPESAPDEGTQSSGP